MSSCRLFYAVSFTPLSNSCVNVQAEARFRPRAITRNMPQLQHKKPHSQSGSPIDVMQFLRLVNSSSRHLRETTAEQKCLQACSHSATDVLFSSYLLSEMAQAVTFLTSLLEVSGFESRTRHQLSWLMFLVGCCPDKCQGSTLSETPKASNHPMRLCLMTGATESDVKLALSTNTFERILYVLIPFVYVQPVSSS
jgi:hypothetical protein